MVTYTVNYKLNTCQFPRPGHPVLKKNITIFITRKYNSRHDNYSAFEIFLICLISLKHLIRNYHIIGLCLWNYWISKEVNVCQRFWGNTRKTLCCLNELLVQVSKVGCELQTHTFQHSDTNFWKVRKTINYWLVDYKYNCIQI